MTVSGKAMVEGDIILGPAALFEQSTIEIERRPADINTESVVISDVNHRWPNKEVVYCIGRDLQNPGRVINAIRHWEANTPIRFRDATSFCNSLVGLIAPHVTFIQSGQCASAVGFQGVHNQVIELTEACTTGNVIHEIGHAVGLWHEQSRADRDQHITIHTENILPQFWPQFTQHINDGVDLGGYDFDSIMHYPAFIPSFAVNPALPVITTIPPNQPIGVREGLSGGDIAAVRLLYQ